MISNLQKFLSSKASFILLALIEKGGRDHLISEVKRSNVKLDKIVAGEHYAKLLNGKNK